MGSGAAGSHGEYEWPLIGGTETCTAERENRRRWRLIRGLPTI
jgi:hypothetical protein